MVAVYFKKDLTYRLIWLKILTNLNAMRMNHFTQTIREFHFKMHLFLAQHTAISSIISIQISDIWCVVTDAGLIHRSAIKLPTTKYGRQNTQYGRQKKNF